jgi:hypothetical protein
MTGMLKGVRPMDAVLAAVLTALGAVLMVLNINADPTDTKGLQHAITNQSWWMLPVFLGTTIPVLWRRRNVLVVALTSTVVMGAHLLAFGWVIRCGAALPLSLVLAYSVGRLADRRESYAGLAVVIVGQVLALVRDSATGLSILPVTAVIALAAWGVGVYVRQHAERPTEHPVASPAAVHV